MLLSLYEIFQHLLFSLARWLRPLIRNARAERFIASRHPALFKNSLEEAQKTLQAESRKTGRPVPCLWLHVASAGELEQAIPPMRELVSRTGARVLLTYFSVSAEPFIKNVPGLLAALPFPADTRANHRLILQSLNIQHLFCVRYDLWPALLSAAKRAQVPTHLLAATHRSARRDPIPWLWSRFRASMYRKFDTIFAVSEDDFRFFSLTCPGSKVLLAGDPKWARARQRAQAIRKNGLSPELSKLQDWLKATRLERKLFVLGSPHAEEHTLALQAMAQAPRRALLVYVPHDIGSESIKRVQYDLRAASLHAVTVSALFSDLETSTQDLAKVDALVVDRMGMLAELYSLADLVLVGGGFDGQIHNTLEPTAHPVPTIFGANVRRAREAQALLETGAALGFATAQDMLYFIVEYLVPGKQPTPPNSASAGERLSESARIATRVFAEIPDTSELVCSRIEEFQQAT